MELNQPNFFPENDFCRELLFSQTQQIPGSLSYELRRFRALEQEYIPESGQIVYQYDSSEKKAHSFQLQFCITGSRYCTVEGCSNCKVKSYKSCNGNTNTVDVFRFCFYPTFLGPFAQTNQQRKKDRVLSFQHTESFSEILPLCPRKKKLLKTLQETSYCSTLQNVLFNSVVHELLLCSCEILEENKNEVFACKFLADNAGLEKMHRAKAILLENIDTLISIKELSKKVAINECYLKKGFKEVFAQTIYDFYLQQKMEHAKFLLYEKGMTVTDVSAVLGYSSISHFSTAFKRQTGIKPCDLLK